MILRRSLAVICIVAAGTVYAQGPLSVNGSISTSDGISAGALWRINQSQIGLNAGVRLGDPERNRIATRIISIAFSQHLFGHSQLSTLRPWFSKAVLWWHYGTSTIDGETHVYHGYLWRAHVGRDFNFTRRLGFRLSAGLHGTLHGHWTRPTRDEPEGPGFDDGVSADAVVYYALGKRTN